MNQHPDPIEPNLVGKLKFAINGDSLPFEPEMIPKLFVAYVAAKRAEYYAGVDAARCDNEKEARECFEGTFAAEMRHAMRDRYEVTDWMENNMNVADEPCDEVGVLYELPRKG